MNIFGYFIRYLYGCFAIFFAARQYPLLSHRWQRARATAGPQQKIFLLAP
jgi:hypothetical protein